jgi:hypothetical protein
MTIETKTRKEFGRDMLGIGSAAAVARNKSRLCGWQWREPMR